MVDFRPVSRETSGDHFSIFFARVMSGRRTLGSSMGRGLRAIFDLLPVSLIMVVASSLSVISWGLPMLTGSLNLDISSL